MSRSSMRLGASVLALCAATTVQAQTIGGSLQSEYVIVTGERARAADPNQPDTQVTAAKAQEQINTVNTEDMLMGRELERVGGVDNLNDKKYFLFHPFPQRTFLMEISYAR